MAGQNAKNSDKSLKNMDYLVWHVNHVREREKARRIHDVLNARPRLRRTQG